MEMGYTKVFALRGGYRAWLTAGLPMEEKWVAEARAECVKCHEEVTPGIVSDGKLSREAWRTVKGCLGAVRDARRPSGLTIRAVRGVDSGWETVRTATEIPIHATWIELWRAIHRTHATAVRRPGSSAADVGVAVVPAPPTDR